MLAPTAAEQALAAWRHARGLDGPQAPLFRPGALPVQAQGGGNPDDLQWQAGFGLPIPDSFVSSLVPMGSVLAVGGYFTQIGDIEAHGVATWDGARWAALGDFPGLYVQDLAPYQDGLLALTDAPNVWRWDGATWSTLAPFPTEPGSPAYYATAMAVDNAQIAVSVWTWTDGIGYRARVFLFGDAGWAPLGGYFDDGVYTLAWYEGRLYAGGMFRALDGAALPRIAVWNGSGWQSIAAGLSSERWDMVTQLAAYGGELVAGGLFRDASDPAGERRSFARWNGARWASLGSAPPNPNLQRMRVIGSDLYALGLFQGNQMSGIARWDGTAWHVGEDHLRWMTWDIASFGGEMYAGGALSADGATAATPLSRLRGGRWEPAVNPGPGMQGLMGWDGPGVYALAAVDGGIVAAGRLEFAGAPGGWVPFTGTARWDGTRWSAFGDVSSDDVEPTDLAWHQGALYAAGYLQSGYVARFENGRWVAVGGLGEPFPNTYCLASAFGNLFVGGGIPCGGSGGIARWDGTKWTSVGRGMTQGNYITSMTAHGDELVVGGDFTEMDGVPCRNVAEWTPRDGWHALGEGLDGPVSDLLSRDGVLYASMLLCGPPGLARWMNGHWERLDGPSQVSALGWYRGRLLASSYQFCGGMAYRDAAGAWHPLGSGLNGAPTAFVEQGRSLFVGGRFSRAGNQPAFGFAEWRGPLPGDDGLPYPTPEPGPIARMAAEPNPSAAVVHLRYSLPAAAHARIEIYDLAGHRVETAFEGEQGVGQQDVIWTPDASRVSAGVYFARVTAGSFQQVVRVVRVE
jgi:hypothetical protein